MISTLFLPQVVLNVPQYLMYNSFGWINSPFYLPLWVPTLFATETYFVYQLVQFMRSMPPRSGRGCRHRRLRPGQDPVQDHCPDAEPLSGGLRSVPVHVELQRLHGSPALRPDPPASTRCPSSSSCPWTLTAAFNWNRILALSLTLHHPAVGRFLLRTGCLHRRHFRRRREGLNAALAVQNLL